MLRIRYFSLLIIALLLVGPTLAGSAGHSDAVVHGINSGKAAVVQNENSNPVIVPAIQLPQGLTPEKREWLQNHINHQARNGRQVVPKRDRRGGPDNFGYSWRDNQEAGVDYNWIDITQGQMQGNQFGDLGDDGLTDATDIGWNFSFYGQNVSQFWVCSNGWMSFQAPDQGGDYWPDGQFPSQSDPNNAIAVFFTDLNGDAGNGNGRVWWYSDPNSQTLIVSWIDYYHIQGDGPYNFQVICTGDGKIKMQYQTNTPTNQGYNVSIGLQDANRDDGLNALFGQGLGVPDNNYAITFATRWIQFQGPGIAVTPAQLDFGDVYVGQDKTINAVIENDGAQDLVISDVQCDEQDFVLPDLGGQDVVIGSGQTMQAPVTFRPEEGRGYAADIRISCNADNADNGVFVVHATGNGVNAPALEIDPQGIEDDLNTGDQNEHVITLSNNGGSDLDWTIKANILHEPGHRDANTRQLRDVNGAAGAVGPQRDNAGDLLGSFQPGIKTGQNQYTSCVGWDWDNDRMWVTDYSTALAAAYTPDANYQNFQESIRIQPGNCMDGCWAKGLLYLPNWANSVINRYNAQGQNVGALQMPYGVFGLAADVENNWLFLLSGNDMYIHVYPLHDDGSIGNEIGQIQNHMQYHNNATCYGLEWVPKHTDGQLWMMDTNADQVYEIHVNTANWTCDAAVQNFSVGPGGDQPYCSVAHDKNNLWAAGFQPNTVRIYDDGVFEAYWLSFNPTSGTLQAGSDTDISVLLNATGLIGGDYEAELHFLSNDPNNADVVADVTMHVTGAPVVDVSWPAADGFPNVIDWNQAFADLFAGGPYPITVVVKNTGTAQLQVSNITFDNNIWSANPTAFNLDPNAVQNVVVTLNAQNPNDDSGIMTVVSNANNDNNFQVHLHGFTHSPPVLVMDANEYETDLLTGATDDFTLNISNQGNALLRWDTDIQITQDGRRDANRRELRNVNEIAAPARPALNASDPALGFAAQAPVGNTANGYFPPAQNNQINPRPAGPRRDDPPAGAFAIFQDQSAWGFYDAWFTQRSPGINVTSYRNAADLVNVDLSQYDCIWVATGEQSQQFTTNWNNNVGRFNDWVDRGGVIFVEQGWNGLHVNEGIGGLVDTRTPQEGQLAPGLGQGGNQANWLVDHMGWQQNEAFPGGSTFHVVYPVARFQNMQNCDFFQVIAIGTSTQEPGIVWYHYGRGNVIVSGSPVGHQWVNHNIAGQWGSCADMLNHWMGDVLAKPQWISVDPKNGQIDGGSDVNTDIHFDATGLNTGTYSADIHFDSNDPANPDQVFTATMNVTGAPDINVKWAAADGYTADQNAVLDWNRHYDPNLFTGGPYDMHVTVKNAGTDSLVVQNAAVDNQYFAVSPAQFTLAPNASQDVTVTMNVAADQPAEYTPTLTFSSNDQDTPEYHVHLHALAALPPVLTMDSNEHETDLLTGETEDFTLNIANQGQAELVWNSQVEIVQEGGRDANLRSLRSVTGMGLNGRDANQRSLRGVSAAQVQPKVGPQRDNLGDQLGTFTWNRAGQNQYKAGIAYDSDNDLLVTTTYSPNWMAVLDPNNNYSVVREWQPAGNPMGCTWLDGVFYTVVWANAYLLKYDINGNALGQMGFNFPPTSVTASKALDLLMVTSGNDDNIYIVNPAGQQQGILQVGNYGQFIGGAWQRSLCWVDKHPDGQLWMNKANNIYELSIDTDNWTATGLVQHFVPNPANPQDWDGLGHDKYNLIYGAFGAQNYIIYDDNVTEAYWIALNPKAGQLQGGADEDVNIHYDAATLVGGTYIADLHFLSNDPANPDQVFRATMNVTGAPNIELKWADADGFPNVLDWNRRYDPNLFTGGPYQMHLTVKNTGTDDLDVQDIAADQGYFSAAPDNFVLSPKGTQDVVVTFNAPADQPGEYNQTLTITSNDADQGQYQVALHALASLPPVLVMGANEYETDHLTGETEDYTLNISNDGQAQLDWTSKIEIVQQPGGRDANVRSLRSVSGVGLNARDANQRSLRSVNDAPANANAGPQRDNAGDLLGSFQPGIKTGQSQYTSCVGWDWDNGRMWITDYSTALAAAYTPDANYQNFQESIRIQPGNCMDGCWAKGLLYLPPWANPTINRYNAQGQNIGALQMPFPVYGLAADVENNWLFLLSGNDMQIHVFPLHDDGSIGNQIGAIANHAQYHNNQTAYGLEWVPKHHDGQLWMMDPSADRVYEIHVNTDNWTCDAAVQNFSVGPGGNQPYCSVAHDKNNLWAAGFSPATARIYDDGVFEPYWITMAPASGQLANGADEDANVHFDATALIGGTYIADIHFFSNDPANPDQVFRATMNVTGAPTINVKWAAADGWTAGEGAVLDWNRHYDPNLFTGGPYDMHITVKNTGTDDLDVQDIAADQGYFSAAPDNFVIGPGQTQDVTVTFNAPADQPGTYNQTLTITSNDNDHGQYQVALHAQASLPPVLVMDSNEYETDHVTGETEDYTLNISNQGQAQLDWTAQLVIVQEPGGRDANARSLRSVGGAGLDGRDASKRSLRQVNEAAQAGPVVGPQRDNLGDQLGTFTWNRAGQNVYKAGIAYDWDNDLIVLTSYSPNWMAVVDPNNNYQTVREWQPGGNPMGCAWLNGVFYTVFWANAALYEFDINGNALGQMNFNFPPTSVTASKELGVILVSSGNDDNIYVVNPQGQQQGIIQAGNYGQFIGGIWQRSLCWVDKHPDGQLWMNKSNNIYELAIDTGNWTATGLVQHFSPNQQNPQDWDGLGHDKYNLIYGAWGAQNYIIYDDNVTEAYWLSLAPKAGQLASGADEDVNIHFDATALIGGTYIADIHFLSNDPANPDQVFRATMNVTGAPNIVAQWDAGAGFPDVVDWNRAYQDLFTGGPYMVPVKITNAGTDILHINDISSDDGTFSCDPASLDIAARADATVQFILNAQADGAHQSTMVIHSDAANNGALEISVQGTTSAPPQIVVDPNDISDNLVTGQTSQHTFNVSNQGAATLRWDTKLEVTQQPGGRDANVRSLRSVRGLEAPASFAVSSRVTGSGMRAQAPAGNTANGYFPQVPINQGNPRAAGPRRDDPPKGAFAIFQDQSAWGFYDAWFAQRSPNINVTSYRNANDLVNVDLSQYDCIWVATGEQSQQFTTNWNNNVGRFNDWVDRGGVIFVEQGWNGMHVNEGIGGLVDTRTPQEGQLAPGLGQGGNVRNWLVDQMGWQQNEAFPGGSTFHVVYPEARFQNMQNSDFYQIIAIGTSTQEPGIVWYHYGRGNVIVSGSPVGHQWVNHNVAGQWGSCADMLNHWMGDILAQPKWATWDPENGQIAPGGDQDVTVTFDATNLIGGDYAGNLHVTSNDPANPDVIVTLELHVTGAPAVATNPVCYPFEGAQPINFASTYVGGQAADSVVMTNNGTDDLVVNDVSSTNADEFTTDLAANATVHPGQALTFHLLFHPTDVGDRQGTIHIATNARNTPEGQQEGLIWFDMTGTGQTPPRIETDPQAGDLITVALPLGADPVTRTLTISNTAGQGGDNLVWDLSVAEVQHGRDANARHLRSVNSVTSAPRRDDPPSSRYLLVERDSPWGYDLETDFRNVNGLQYTRIQNPNDLDNVNLGDYQVIWFANYQADDWNTQYNNHIAAIENWVDHGGVYYMGSGTNNWNVAPTHPGGLQRHAQVYESVGITQVGQDVNTCFQRLGWDQGHQCHGNSFSHACYDVDALNQLQNSNGYQVMFAGQQSGIPSVVSYNYGHGTCVVSGCTDGYLEVNYSQDGEWGSQAARQAILWYLDDLANQGPSWLSEDPTRGSIAQGQATDVTLTFNTNGLAADTDYLADLTITSNDPINPSIVVHVRLHTGELAPQHFSFTQTETSHSLMISDALFDDKELTSGWEVGVFTPGAICAGATVWFGGGANNIAAYGDDPNTQEVEGFTQGEAFAFKVWDNQANQEYDATPNYTNGPNTWVSGGQTTLSLTGFTMRRLQVDLTAGWNLISVNVVPSQDLWVNQSGPDIRRMMAQLREGDQTHLLLMKDENGNFYAPAIGDFNNIPYWNLQKGYQVKVDQDISVAWTGAPIAANADVPISSGWNMIAYYPTYQLDAGSGSHFYVVSPILENVVIAKNAAGQFMVPRIPFSNMDPWMPGQGYQINVNQDVVLNYPAQQQGQASLPVERPRDALVGKWARPASTGSNMSVLLTKFTGLEVANGDQIAAFSPSGLLVGVGTVEDGKCGLAVWGDDPSTQLVDGLLKGEAFTLKLWKADKDQILPLSAGAIQMGDGFVYQTDAFTVAEASVGVDIPVAYYLGQNYPNPFNSTTRIAYGLPEASRVSIRVYDVAGRVVATLVNGELQAGHHAAVWNADRMTSGLYLIKMESRSFSDVKKVMLVK